MPFIPAAELRSIQNNKPPEVTQMDKPKGAPTWMKDKIWKSNVKKVGTETLEEL
jgi:hypothetical protein